MTTEIEAAPALLDQNLARARELADWRRSGVLTDAEYATAYRALVGGAEIGPRCACGAPATVGVNCAEHVSVAAIMRAAQAACPIVDLSRCSTRERLITTVMTALEKSGQEKHAGRFAERAEHAPGMNALVMIAREYIRLQNELELK